MHDPCDEVMALENEREDEEEQDDVEFDQYNRLVPRFDRDEEDQRDNPRYPPR